MDDTIKTMLDDEIKRTLDEISKVKTTSEEAKAALSKLNMLYGNRMKELDAMAKEREAIDADYAKTQEIELKKAELENRAKQSEAELQLKTQELAQKDSELAEAKRGRRWRTLLDILGISAPLVTTGWWIHKGMEFEEKGQIYSSRTMQWVSSFTRLFGKRG